MVGLYSGGLYLDEDAKCEKDFLSKKRIICPNNLEKCPKNRKECLKYQKVCPITRMLEVAGYKRKSL
jgi:hypothetical protein